MEMNYKGALKGLNLSAMGEAHGFPEDIL